MSGMMKQTTSNRINYLDVAKGFSALLVVLGHIISTYSNPLQVWIYSFHIPAFFIVTGMIYANSSSIYQISIKDFIYQRATKLMYPYCTFGLIFLLRYSFQVLFGSYNGLNIIIYLINLLTLIGVSVLWYLSTLFLAEIIFVVIVKFNNKLRILCVVTLLIVTILASLLGGTLMWDGDRISADMYFILLFKVFSATIFLIVGFYTFRPIQKSIKNLDIIMVFILLPLSIILSQINGDVDLNKFELGNPFIYYTASIIGSIALIFISKLINQNRLLLFFGKNSLLIMTTHSIFGVYKFSEFLIRLIPIFAFSFYVEKVLILVITMIFEVIIILIINKFFLFLIKMPSKKRRLLF